MGKRVKMKTKPIYKKEDFYISPFSEFRSEDEYGRTGYLPLQQSITPIGIKVLDEMLEELQTGDQDFTVFCERYNMDIAAANTLCQVFFGCTREDLRYYFLLRKADDLLRYTNLPIGEVAVRSGLGTHVNLCYTYQRHYGCTPLERRKQLRMKGDLGRYRI